MHGYVAKKKSEEHVFLEVRKKSKKGKKKAMLKIKLKINQVENK